MLPVIAVLTFTPLVLERVARRESWNAPVSIYLVASAVELAIVGLGYHLLLTWQARLLQRRETRILERVTAPDE